MSSHKRGNATKGAFLTADVTKAFFVASRRLNLSRTGMRGNWCGASWGDEQ